MLRALTLSLAVCLSLHAFARPASAQARNEARLFVTVVDQTTSVIPAATVTVVGLDDTTKRVSPPPAKTSDRGVATIEHLPPGRYSVTGEFPGFDLGLLRDIRLKAGDNRHVLVLPLQKIAAEVTVGRDVQTSASDRASTFGTALTREQVEALSEEPDEMRRQIQDLAGPGATIRVDSFEGQQLPPKAQIKAVHITRDAFAAENHYAGGVWIDIITQPGMGPLRGSTRFSFYNSKLDGENPLIPKKGPAQTQSFGVSLSGTLQKERSGYSISVSGSNAFTTPNLYLAVPAGQVARNVNLRQPNDNLFVYGSLDYALTKDQTLRVGFSSDRSSQENQGVGAYDLVGRAYSSDSRGWSFRLQEAGPIGRRFFLNTRFNVQWSSSSSASALEEPTIVVLDSFTSGGAQRAGGRKMVGYAFNTDLDYVRGRHSWRSGIQVSGSNYRSDDFSNYLGTYTFESLAAYEAGLPRSYTRRIGDPLIEYRNLQAGFYVQDDIRLRKNLTLSPGLRYEAQSLSPDASNFGPRMGITWSPFKSGKTTLRASAGIFFDWLSTGIYEQTLRVDGVRQREMNVIDPSYPDPGSSGVIPPTNKYLLGADVRMAQTSRVSAGIEQQVTKTIRVGGTYARTWGDALLVGWNHNAPVDGVRPDPSFVNVIEATSDGASRAHTFSAYSNISLSSSSPQGIVFVSAPTSASGPRFAWRRGLSVFVNYGAGKSENNTDGAFSVPATGSLAAEWGPSSMDTRQRFSVGVSTSALKNLSASIYFNASSGSPYTIRTGYDDNGDLIFNDRPSGVGRNTERMPWRRDSYAYLTYTIGVGKRTVALPPGITITSGGAGGFSVGTTSGQSAARYRVNLNASIQNLTNHASYTGYSGVMTSPFFKQPTSVAGVRTMNFSVGFSF
jgi:hypothetical protein